MLNIQMVLKNRMKIYNRRDLLLFKKVVIIFDIM